MGKKRAVKIPKKVEQEREVVYPKLEVFKRVGDDPITLEFAKQLLGWQEEPAASEGDEVPERFGDDYQLEDHQGNKVRLLNNVTNRPIYRGVLDTLEQEILRRKWRLNGEPIIIGNKGSVLNGQHTLISLVLAEQSRDGDQADHWAEYWQGPCTIEKLIVAGIEESDDVVNTMDTARPRSEADVIYRSEWFRDKPPKERKLAARLAGHAVRLLWQRTGAYQSSDAFSVRRTHLEMADWLNRHLSLLRCVNYIIAEDGEKAISKWITPGYASALMYLMAASGTDGDLYRNSQTPGEKGKGKVTFDYWQQAEEFWTLLGAGAAVIQPVRDALADLGTGQSGRAGGTLREKLCVLIKAWHKWRDGEVIGPEDLQLRYVTDSNGIKQLCDWAECGGIDMDPDREDAEEAWQLNQLGDGPEDMEGSNDEDAEANQEPEPEGPLPGDPLPDELEQAKAAKRQRLIQQARQRREAKERAAREAANGTGPLDQVAARAEAASNGVEQGAEAE